jgi:integrase
MKRTLTDAKARKAKPQAKPYKLNDGGGMYLYITTNGTKSWRYNFKLNDKWLTLTYGQFPSLGLSEAREAHDKAKSKVKQGIDPRSNGNQSSSLQPFSYYAKQQIKISDIKEATRTKKLLKMEKHLFPILDKMNVDKITAKDLQDILLPIAERGHRSLAKDLSGYCRQTFGYLRNLQLIENSPATYLSEVLPKPSTKQNFPHITKETDLAKLIRGIDKYHGQASVKYALQIMPLLVLRPNNIRHLKWDYVDLKNALITIPAEDMKANREHKLPLPTQAVDILKQLQALTGQNVYVFNSGYGDQTKPMSENTLNMALTRVIDEDTGEAFGRGFITSHGIRHTVSTFLNEQRYDRDAIELQLAHVDKDRIRAVYNKSELIAERTIMMQEWADYLDGLKNASK